jgi:hypothetical protein
VFFQHHHKSSLLSCISFLLFVFVFETGSYYVAQAGFELFNLLASTSQELGLKCMLLCLASELYFSVNTKPRGHFRNTL